MKNAYAHGSLNADSAHFVRRGYYEGCDEDGRPACCRVITSGSPTTSRFWLEQLQEDGSWLEVEGPQFTSNGWSTGTISGGEIDLSAFWASWNFKPFHQYTVQFVIENRQCRNGIENPNPNGWNNLDRTIFICPEGTGCKFGIDEREIVISPNPANSIIQLQHFKPDLDRNYVMTITDMTGRLVKNIPLTADRVDISGLQSGMFVVSIFREGERVFNSKLVVNQ